MKWKNISIGKKIYLGSVLMIMVVVVVSILNYVGVIGVHNNSHQVLEISDLIHSLTLREIDHLLWSEKLRDIKDFDVDPDIEMDPTKCALGLWLQSDIRLELEEDIPMTAAILAKLTNIHSEMHYSAQKVLAAADKDEAGKIYRDETQANLILVRGYLDELTELLESHQAITVEKMDVTLHGLIERSIFVPIIAIFVGLILAFVITRTITGPIELLTKAMEKSAAGDLQVEVFYEAEDEAGKMVKSFNEMLNNLKRIVGASQRTVDQTVAASQSTSAATEELNASIEQVASSVTELAVSATDISMQTQKINDAAHTTGELAESGSQKIESCLQSMLLIEDASNETDAAIAGLRVATSEIAQIVHVVTDIADQTNLLSLNAAIEAARAGEYGRGFAVVAEEVRKLAEQTKVSLGEINDLVANLEVQMNTAIKSTGVSKEKVSQGTAVVQETTKSLKEIVTQIAGIMEQLRIIADRTQDQAAASQEIAAMTEEQAASTDGIAGSTVELATVAQQLEDIIKQLKV